MMEMVTHGGRALYTPSLQCLSVSCSIHHNPFSWLLDQGTDSFSTNIQLKCVSPCFCLSRFCNFEAFPGEELHLLHVCLELPGADYGQPSRSLMHSASPCGDVGRKRNPRDGELESQSPEIQNKSTFIK